MSDTEPEIVILTDEVKSEAVRIEFADGWQIIPRWMVAHLGGTQAVTSPASLALAREMTFATFNQRFFQKASAEALRGVQGRIISEHLKGLPRR